LRSSVASALALILLLASLCPAAPTAVPRSLDQLQVAPGILDPEDVERAQLEPPIAWDQTRARIMPGARRISLLLPDRLTVPADDSGWIPIFGEQGADAPPRAILEYNGSMVIGGDFQEVCGAQISFLARWNGKGWSPLGPGVNGRVRALMLHQGMLVAAGDFTQAGGAPANHIAIWDGSNWAPLGSGVDGNVWTVLSWNGNLYAGGEFLNAGGASAKYIARWSGASWSALGQGTNDWVRALAVFQNALFVGGDFTTAGPGPAAQIARWDGANWSALGSGTNAPVFALEVYNNELVAGGLFTLAGGGYAKRIARWNGTSWGTFGLGFNDFVWDLTTAGSDLIAVGFFTGLYENQGHARVARWNGATWEALGGGLGGTCWAVTAIGDDLFFGGSFTLADGDGARRLARWSNNEWLSIGGGMGAWTRTLIDFEGDLIAGGDFLKAGGRNATGVARWDGMSWHKMGNGFPGMGVNAFEVFRGELYANGFTELTSLISRWNGNSWVSIGACDEIVRDLHVHNDRLMACGSVSGIDGVIVGGLAQWDGQTWSDAGHSFNLGTNQFVWSLASLGTDLIAGGDFVESAGDPGDHVARYDGITWQPMANGFPDRVRILGVHAGELYAGGRFSVVEGKDFLRHIARWNGEGWVSVGSGLNGVVRTITSLGSDLIGGGSFGSSGGGIASRIARFDGEEWSGLGTGASFDVTTAWGRGSDVYICGRFETAGQKPARYIALWTDAPPTVPEVPLVIHEHDAPAMPIALFPNPFRESTTIRYSVPSAGRVSLHVYDVAGRRIRDLVETVQEEGEHRITWNGLDSAGRAVVPGVYFYRLDAPSVSKTGKLVRAGTR